MPTIKGGKGKPPPKKRASSGPRGRPNKKLSDAFKSSIKRMWLEIEQDGEVFCTKDVESWAEAYYDIIYAENKTYHILRQEDGWCKPWFWKWYLRDEDDDEFVWTLYLEEV